MKTQELTVTNKMMTTVKEANSIMIASPKDMAGATTYLSYLNKQLDKLIEKKEQLTKPINIALKEIRARYKPAEVLLEETIDSLKKKMGAYQSEALRVQKEEEDKIAQKVADGKIKVETAIKKLGNIETPESKVETEEGAITFRTVKKFEVMDVVLLAPIDGGVFVTPNDTTIRQAMKDGRELAGVRYYEEQIVWNNRN